MSVGLAGAQGEVTDATFGIIPDSLFRMQASAGDPGVPYMVTNKEVDISFQEREGRIIAVARHHVRLKVYDASTRAASMVSVPYYDQDNMEQISNIRGYTHLPSGKRVPLEANTIKTIDINGRHKVKEFTLPAVEDGAVLEYSYVIHRRYIEELPDFYISQKVPTSNAKVTITYPQYLRYESVVENYDQPLQHDFTYTDTSSVPKIFTLPRPDPVITERWIATDIPPVEEEPFISSVNDYRGKIKFILKAFGLPRQQLDISWEVVVAKLRRDANPWSRVKEYGRAKALGDSIADVHPEIPQRALQDTIYRYLNQRVSFSGSHAPYSNLADTVVLSGKPADQAAINQTLLAMLRGAGIEANPLLTSTRSSGRINREFPSFYQFTALAIQSEVEGETYTMDASFPYSQPGLIPVEMNNGEGLLLREDTFSWVPLQTAENGVNIRVQVDGQLQADGTLTGEIVSRQHGYPAQLIRRQKADGRSDAEILKQTLFDGYAQMSIDHITINRLHSYADPVEIRAEFRIENYATSFSDGLRFRPMLVGYRMENPFRNDERSLPVTLKAPEHLRVSYNISLPQGFGMENGSENHAVQMSGAAFEESYNMQPGMLAYEYKIDISRQNFAVEQFNQLYRLYERWVELSNSHWM
ncbi:MAG TPA: DUF3857 domain-containing protein, partial [Fodinibius sp.]|nr:DUF3857 domain-containing protein [Fodinibius sp.]